jgi:hypothetical protein
VAADDALDLPGVHAAPNIQGAPDVYALENLAVDPERRIEAAERAICRDGAIRVHSGVECSVCLH